MMKMIRKQSPITNKIVMSITLGLILSLALGSIIIATVPATTSPMVSLTEKGPISMTTESSSRVEPLTDSFDGCVLNTTPFPGDSQWTQDVFSMGNSSEYTASNGTDGLHITSTNSEFAFSTNLNIGLRNLTSLTFSVEIEGISGRTKVSMYTGFRRLSYLMSVPINSSFWNFTHFEIINHYESGDCEALEFAAPLDMIRNATDDWIVQVEFRIYVTILEASSCIIKSAHVDAVYSIEVSPIIIDVQTTNGESLYSNQYAFYLNPNPFLNITDRTTNTSSVVMVYTGTETVYLPIGVYNGTAGWWVPTRFNETTIIDFTIEEDSVTLLEVEVLTIEVTVDVVPNVPSIRFSMRFRDPKSGITITPGDGVSYSYQYYSFMQMSTSTEISLYIPLIDGDLLVEITSWDSNLFNYDYHTVKYETGVDGSANVELVITLPYFEFLGLALAPGETIVFSVIVAIFLVGFVLLWRNTDIQVWQHLRSDPRSLPFIFLVGCLFMPWFTISMSSTLLGNGLSIHYAAFVALLVIFASSNGSLILPVNFTIWPYLPAAILTLWLPLFLMVRSFRGSMKFDLPYVYSLIGPFLMFVSTVLYSSYLGAVINISIGGYLAMLVPIAGVLIYTYNRFWKYRENLTGESD